jgi:O-antigen/teichoic acid export membrane protein
MLSGLVRNVAISAVSFVAVSVIGLLLVPLLVGKYGLLGFGFISVARLFLPTTALGFLDFGFGEITTQSIARTRVDHDWRRATGIIGLSAGRALVMGLCSGLVLAGLAAFIPGWMGIASDGQAGMTNVFLANALIMPLLFMSLAFEGAIKGFERFDVLRGIEVTTALSYAAAVLWAVWGDHEPEMVCYGYLGSLVLRTALSFAWTLFLLRGREVCLRCELPSDQDWFRRQCRLFAANRALGTAQAQLPSVVIGLVIGPAAVGIYEAVSRLPRAIKIVLGLLNSTVLPLAARLDHAADKKGLRRLGQTGVLMVGLVSLPPLAVAMAFSRPILQLWLGDAFVPYWGWQALLFLVPATTVLVNFGGTALLVRPHVVRKLNLLALCQLLIQYLISIATLPWFDEGAFILGQAVSVCLIFVVQFRFIGRELGVDNSLYRALSRLLAAILVMAIPGVWVATFVQGWPSLVLLSGLWVMLTGMFGLGLALDARQRSKLMEVLRSRALRRRAKEPN